MSFFFQKCRISSSKDVIFNFGETGLNIGTSIALIKNSSHHTGTSEKLAVPPWFLCLAGTSAGYALKGEYPHP
jgi:hypothetical protein